MSCSDKHVIAWKSFEIGDGILYTEDDVKKICPTPSSPSSLGLVPPFYTDKCQKTVSLNSSLLLLFLENKYNL
jgi:hypothetical protein